MYYHDILGDPPTKAQMATLDRRKIEAEILRRLNKALKRCQKERKTDRDYIKAVIEKNSALWKYFSNSVMDPQSGLPDDVRAGIFSLARFSQEHGNLVLQGQATVDQLIEVNQNIAQGLMGGK